jgi:two-component system, NarL family, sensor histidine kinase BarA
MFLTILSKSYGSQALASVPRWRTDHRVQLWAGCVLLLLCVWGGLAVAVFDTVQNTRERQRARATATANGFAEYFRLHLMQVDRMLQNLRETYAQTGTLPEHQLLLAGLHDKGSVVINVAVAGADGVIDAGAQPAAGPVDVSDREYFQALQRDPRDRLYVGPPVFGRMSKQLAIPMARPILDASGQFRGVIFAAVDPLLLQRYFQSVDAFANGGAISLIQVHAARVLARFTGSTLSGGQSLEGAENWDSIATRASGTFEARSVIDGKARIFGFSRVGDFPVAVLASAEISDRPVLTAPSFLAAIVLGLVCTASLVFLTRLLSRRAREQQRVIARLQESRAREAEANRMKSGFLASVSHELRTPLNAILGFSELIRDHGCDAQVRQYADLIHNSGNHLHSLVNTLLDLAKIEAGRMELHRETLDVGALVRTLVDTHRVAAEKKGLQMILEMTLPRGTRVQADTDRMKLTQIMNNVLHNAVKFTAKGSVRTVVGVVGATLVVRVTDTGCGIAAHHLPHVFERFRRAHDEIGELEGTGLGLPLTRELLTLLGGTIALQSWLGAGTTVEIRLPGVQIVEE